MAKSKAKAAPTETELAAAIGVTVERFRRDEWARDKPTVHYGAKIEHPPYRMSRIARLRKDGWIDEAGAGALARYEELAEASGYGHVRSCCDNTPRGGAGDMPGRVIRSRWDLARLRNDVTRAGVLPFALIVVHELLFDPESMPDVRARLIGGTRDQCAAEAKALVGAVAVAMTAALASKIAA